MIQPPKNHKNAIPSNRGWHDPKSGRLLIPCAGLLDIIRKEKAREHIVTKSEKIMTTYQVETELDPIVDDVESPIEELTTEVTPEVTTEVTPEVRTLKLNKKKRKKKEKVNDNQDS